MSVASRRAAAHEEALLPHNFDKEGAVVPLAPLCLESQPVSARAFGRLQLVGIWPEQPIRKIGGKIAFGGACGVDKCFDVGGCGTGERGRRPRSTSRRAPVPFGVGAASRTVEDPATSTPSMPTKASPRP